MQCRPQSYQAVIPFAAQVGIAALKVTNALLFIVFLPPPAHVGIAALKVTKVTVFTIFPPCPRGCWRPRSYPSIAIYSVSPSAQVGVPTFEVTKEFLTTVFRPPRRLGDSSRYGACSHSVWVLGRHADDEEPLNGPWSWSHGRITMRVSSIACWRSFATMGPSWVSRTKSVEQLLSAELPLTGFNLMLFVLKFQRIGLTNVLV